MKVFLLWAPCSHKGSLGLRTWAQSAEEPLHPRTPGLRGRTQPELPLRDNQPHAGLTCDSLRVPSDPLLRTEPGSTRDARATLPLALRTSLTHPPWGWALLGGLSPGGSDGGGLTHQSEVSARCRGGWGNVTSSS